MTAAGAAAATTGIGQGDERDAHLRRTLVVAVANTIGTRVLRQSQQSIGALARYELRFQIVLDIGIQLIGHYVDVLSCVALLSVVCCNSL